MKVLLLCALAALAAARPPKGGDGPEPLDWDSIEACLGIDKDGFKELMDKEDKTSADLDILADINNWDGECPEDAEATKKKRQQETPTCQQNLKYVLAPMAKKVDDATFELCFGFAKNEVLDQNDENCEDTMEAILNAACPTGYVPAGEGASSPPTKPPTTTEAVEVSSEEDDDDDDDDDKRKLVALKRKLIEVLQARLAKKGKKGEGRMGMSMNSDDADNMVDSADLDSLLGDDFNDDKSASKEKPSSRPPPTTTEAAVEVADDDDDEEVIEDLETRLYTALKKRMRGEGEKKNPNDIMDKLDEAMENLDDKMGELAEDMKTKPSPPPTTAEAPVETTEASEETADADVDSADDDDDDDDDDDEDKRVLIEALKRKLIASYRKRADEEEEETEEVKKASALRKLNRIINALGFGRDDIVGCIGMNRDEIKELECDDVKDIIAQLREGECPSGEDITDFQDVSTPPTTTEAANSADDDDDDDDDELITNTRALIQDLRRKLYLASLKRREEAGPSSPKPPKSSRPPPSTTAASADGSKRFAALKKRLYGLLQNDLGKVFGN